MSFDPIANIMDRDGVDEREAIKRYAVEAAAPDYKVCEVPDCPGFGFDHPPLPSASYADLLRDRFDRVVSDAVNEVERMARWMLLHHPVLDEFVMGMGTAFFTTALPGNRVNLMHVGNVEPQWKPLADFFDEWDDTLKLTGHPMRFTATGEKVTKW